MSESNTIVINTHPIKRIKSGNRLVPMAYEVMDCIKRIMKKNDNNIGRTISVGSDFEYVAEEMQKISRQNEKYNSKIK